MLFSFPPNLGNVGTAAYLDVFRSVYAILRALKERGYTVDLPADAEELRQMVIEGRGDPAASPLLHGTDAAVAGFLNVEDYRRLFPAYTEIEPHWGRAPGELLSDGRRLRILGRRFGNIFVGVQPPFGYERDPMRMLMARDAAPNHAFAAFYTWLRHEFQAHAVIHVGTHGALEFMPGKQSGLSADCWPARLIGDLPNFYLYSVNNPSEAAIAKRRSGATLISYLVPPLQQAGLYKGLRQLKDAIDAYRQRPDAGMLATIRELAAKLGPGADAPADRSSDADYLAHLSHELLQIEQRMIPAGLHVFGARLRPKNWWTCWPSPRPFTASGCAARRRPCRPSSPAAWGWTMRRCRSGWPAICRPRSPGGRLRPAARRVSGASWVGRRWRSAATTRVTWRRWPTSLATCSRG